MSTNAEPVTDPARRIGELRTAIDDCDAQIIELVRRRLAISREIGALRAAAGSEPTAARGVPSPPLGDVSRSSARSLRPRLPTP